MSKILRTYLQEMLDAYRQARAVYIDVNDRSDKLQEICNKDLRSGKLSPMGADDRRKATREAIAEMQKNELIPAIEKAQAEFAKIRERVGIDFSDLYRANAARLDMPVIELLKTGILTDQELLELANNYTDNNTMLRVLAAEARNRCDKSPESRNLLLNLAIKNDSIVTSGTPVPLEAVDAMATLCNSALRLDRVSADGVARSLDELADEVMAQYGDIAV